MPIQVTCDCGKTLNVPDKLAGKTIRCKECSESIKVPLGRLSEGDDEEDEDSYESAPLRPKTKEVRLPGAVNRPKKKKKKSSAASEDAGIPKWVMAVAIVIGLGVGGFGAYLGVKGLSGAAQIAAGPPATVPETFSRHVTEHGGFSFEYPDDWEVSSGGGTGGRPPWGKFSRGDVSFEMRADLKGAPVADIVSINDSGEEVDERSPAARVHQFQHDIKYSLEFKDFKEQPGAAYETPYGTGWMSEFTASDGSFSGGKIHGYRLTLLGGVHQFNVICKCSEKNWESYKPLFERTMKSISRN